jgi:preflagellin peptidase FlaK
VTETGLVLAAGPKLVELGSLAASAPDLLRLLAVVALGWAAWRDVEIRRVPDELWYPLAALGVVLLGWDAWALGLFDPGPAASLAAQRLPIQAAISLLVVAPFAYLVWWFGGFGGADAKALMTLSVLFPAYPTYVVATGGDVPTVLPMTVTPVAVFSLTVLSNTVVLGATYPGYLTVRNLLAGELSALMFVGRRVPAASIPRRHGSLLETPDGRTRRGLDVDALRMYLRWRGVTLADLREAPDRHRDPASLPAEFGDPTDGALATDGGTKPTATDDRAGREQAATGEAPERRPSAGDHADPWGAEAFVADVGEPYGTTAADLRAGLEVLATRDRVWYSPGIPFVVPMFAGLLAGLVYGDLLFGLLAGLGLG